MKFIALSLSLVFMAACSGDDGGETPEADASVGGGGIAYMEPCDLDDDQCDTSMELVCFGFNMKGPHCTHSCEVDTDCEAPSPGCNGMGVCKAPDL